MATVKLMLKKNKPLKDSKYPYVIRVSSLGREKYIVIDSATETQFDKKTGLLKINHPNYLKSNRTANKLLSDIQDKIYEAMINNVEISVDDLVKERKEKVTMDFFSIGEAKRDFYLKCGKQGTYMRWKSVIKKFKEFIGADLPIDDITPELLIEYRDHLYKTNNSNTVFSNFKVLKMIYKQGIILGAVDNRPFDAIELHKVEVFKDRLTRDEIVLIENLELLPPVMELARDMFLFSFYCWGIRFRDVALLKKENIKGNTLTYTTSKSGFSKRITIQMNDKCLSIIKKHSTNGVYLFPLLKHSYDDPLKYEHAVSSINSVLNKSLKSIAIKAKIDKTISFHTARHSFVDILKKKGLPIEMRMQLVGHTSEKVHKQYHGDFDYEEMSDIVNRMI